MSHPSRRWGVVALCFALSGFAGLLYETVWFRQFAGVFGTSEAAMGAVLAGYMGGLTLGAIAAARWGRRVTRPVLAYGLLELGVAVGALLIPLGLDVAGTVRVLLCGGQALPPDAGGWLEIVVNTSGTFLLLLLPTACMGATLPLLAAHVVRPGEPAEGRIATLYGINTLGAVLGTLVTAFVCLPNFGLSLTVLVGVGINLAVFGLAWWVQSGEGRGVRGEGRAKTDAAAPESVLRLTPSGSPILLAIVFASGLTAFAYEVTWTRILGHILGGSVFAFATMLAAFLIGISAGGLFAGAAIKRGRSARSMLVAAQVMTAVGTAVAFVLVEWLPSWRSGLDAQSWLGGSLLSLIVLLPSTLGIGLTLPLAIEWCRGDAASAGRLYAASTLGAICGALLAGNVLLPLLGFRGLFAVGVAINLALAFGVRFIERALLPVESSPVGLVPAESCIPSHERCGDFEWPAMRVPAGASPTENASIGPLPFETLATGRSARPKTMLVLLAVTAACVALISVADVESIVRTSPLLNEPLGGRLVFAAVGRSSTVVLLEQGGEFRLATNGLPESVIAARGSVAGSEAGLRWLTALPYLARPDAESVLIVGLGGGGAVSGVPASVREIHAIELEPEVISAVKSVAHLRLHDPLSDPRVRIIHNDARAALALTSRRYDIIVSQPSHPWTAGASHIYTREFLQLARQHLLQDGVFVQWMDAKFIDEPLLKTIGATLLDSFEHARLYQPHPGTFLFLASQAPLEVEARILQTGEPLRSHHKQLSWLGINDLPEVAAALSLDHAGLTTYCTGAAINTDDRNVLAMQSVSGGVRGLGDAAAELFSDLDPLIDRAGSPSLLSRHAIDPASVVRRLTRTQFRPRAERITESLANSIDRSACRGMLASAKGDVPTARERFVEVLVARPNDRNSRFKLIEPLLQLAANRNAPPEFVQLVSSSTTTEQAVVEAARRYYRKDFAGLKQLDGELSLARPSDACFAQSLLFRALWRAKVTQSSRKSELAQEAIEMSDRALAIEPTVFGGLVRWWAAKSLDDAAMTVESAAYLVIAMQSQPAALSPSSAMQLAQQVTVELDRIEAETSFSRERLIEVRALYRQVEQAAGR